MTTPELDARDGDAAGFIEAVRRTLHDQGCVLLRGALPAARCVEFADMFDRTPMMPNSRNTVRMRLRMVACCSTTRTLRFERSYVVNAHPPASH